MTPGLSSVLTESGGAHEDSLMFFARWIIARVGVNISSVKRSSFRSDFHLKTEGHALISPMGSLSSMPYPT